MMGHILNHKIDSPHPTTCVFLSKADDKLKSNSLFVIHSFNDFHAEYVFMQLDITKYRTLRVY